MIFKYKYIYQLKFFREYALRRVRDGFKQNKSIVDEAELKNSIMKAENSLNVIKRQVWYLTVLLKFKFYLIKLII